MSWFTLLRLLLQLSVYAAKFVSDRQLMESGEVRAFMKITEDADRRVRDAAEARRRSDDDSNSGGLHRSDGHRRD